MPNVELTKERADALKTLRLIRKFSPEDVVKGTGVSERTYLRWETREVDHMRENNLRRVLDNLGASLESFLSGETNGPGPSEIVEFTANRLKLEASKHPLTACSLLWVTEDVDKVLMSVLQAARGSIRNGEVYQDLLYGGLLRRGVSISSFLRALQSLPHEDCVPRVALDLDESLSKLCISIDNRPVLEVPDPLLLWECSCLPKDLSKMLQKKGYKVRPCTIHSDEIGNTLMDLTSREFVTLRFQNVRILWRQSRQIWPPSIDSVYMLRNLASAGVFAASIESVLDVGCGTGILGICIARNNPAVRRVALADWLLTPLVHSALNASANLNTLPVKWEVRLGMFDDWIDSGHSGELYDIVVCTPPYLPNARGFESVREESPVAGTELVNYLIENPIAKESYVTISSLIQEDAKNLARKRKIAMDLIAPPLHVPFRVPPALRSPGYIQALLASKQLKFKPHHRFPLWHEIMTFRLSMTARSRK